MTWNIGIVDFEHYRFGVFWYLLLFTWNSMRSSGLFQEKPTKPLVAWNNLCRPNESLASCGFKGFPWSFMYSKGFEVLGVDFASWHARERESERERDRIGGGGERIRKASLFTTDASDSKRCFCDFFASVLYRFFKFVFLSFIYFLFFVGDRS